MDSTSDAGKVLTPNSDSISAPVVVIGAGPAGLTAAYELLKLKPLSAPLVLEATHKVGGIARTEDYKGYRFDIGGHRFFTKVSEVDQLWHEVMDEQDLIDVRRQSRIYFGGKYYKYPLEVSNALANLGIYESARMMLSYAKWKLRPHPEEYNFQNWVINRFGGRLYWRFFHTYTQKVWGIPCTEIRADWAAQRIKNLSLAKAVWNALTGRNDTTSLIATFKYPRLGPGMMWERFREKVEVRGGRVWMRSPVQRVYHNGSCVTGVEIQRHEGAESCLVRGDHFISTMPITELVQKMTPAAPKSVLAAASGLKYRDFLIVTLILDHPDPFPDNWVYIHSSEVNVGRIQNFRSWSAEMVPDPRRASLGMEYFCHEGDGLWNMSDQDLIALASRELEHLGLVSSKHIVDGTVIRQPKAYPVYDSTYSSNLATIRAWIDTFANIQTIGRNGMHRYNNQDHSMLTAMLAARNVMGEKHDLWNVNVERSYHEEFSIGEARNRAKLQNSRGVAEESMPSATAPALM
jgi:protoporphyrinogen oxidase